MGAFSRAPFVANRPRSIASTGTRRPRLTSRQPCPRTVRRKSRRPLPPATNSCGLSRPFCVFNGCDGGSGRLPNGFIGQPAPRQNTCELAIWSCRRLGELIRLGQEKKILAGHGGDRKSKLHDANLIQLDDAGIEYKQPHRAQKLADIPEETIRENKPGGAFWLCSPQAVTCPAGRH